MKSPPTTKSTTQHELDELSRTAEGVLLYPVVGQQLDESAMIQGHRYRFLTVDLSASAEKIRATLLSVPNQAVGMDESESG